MILEAQIDDWFCSKNWKWSKFSGWRDLITYISRPVFSVIHLLVEELHFVQFLGFSARNLFSLFKNEFSDTNIHENVSVCFECELF